MSSRRSDDGSLLYAATLNAAATSLWGVDMAKVDSNSAGSASDWQVRIPRKTRPNPCFSRWVCGNREKDSPRTTQVLDRFIVPSHMYRSANASSIDVRALMMRIPGCVRRVLKFQRRRPPWPNSLAKSPSKTLSPHTKEKPIIFARFWSILQYLTITFESFILAFYWGPLTPGLPHT